MRRRYCTLDVFTSQKLAGNPLAVVWDCADLTSGEMQNIAREFNLSETVFVLEPRNPMNAARLKIFTPQTELPFAGHPTIGAAICVAADKGRQFAGSRDLIVILEEEVGDIRCHVRLEKAGAHFAYFEAPRLPEKIGDADPERVARALSLEAADIGFDAHAPRVYSAGVPFCFVPLKSLECVARARPDMAHFEQALTGGIGVFCYSRQTMDAENAAHARMFAPQSGIFEDPATGSAAAAFAGPAVEFERPADGDHTLVLEQGFEMGRPSRIILGLHVAQGALRGMTIGGHAVIIAEGTLDL